MSTPVGFDELIHPATRLSVVALLAATEWADFAFVRDSLSLSDSALSKQLHTLEEAGYLELHKEGGGRKRRTRVRLTDRGRTAFEGHVAALRAIVDGAGSPSATATPARQGQHSEAGR
ncbi:transcriptional regulator [Streptomyces sp. NPDC014892]|uniref:transcriptional regulator n=1 Tax=Streptomyces sp. NPDC014892 TaxID=3364930 RepID=UPI0036F7E97E